MTSAAVPTRKYTVADWKRLPDRPRFELIDGDLTMQAQPTPVHQEVGLRLGAQLVMYLNGKRCRAMHDTSVYLSENDQTVFAPDLMVVCDPSKIKENYVFGAPDLVVEILSPSTAKIDKTLKLKRYQQAGVREYWIVDPKHQLIDVYLWDNGPVPAHTYARDDRLHVGVLDDCEIDLSFVFPEMDEPEINPLDVERFE